MGDSWGEGLILMFIRRSSYTVVAVVMFSLPAQLSCRADKLRSGYCGVTIAVLFEFAMICKLC
jgi:hypothetical protein